jgi:hypothetical protein
VNRKNSTLAVEFIAPVLLSAIGLFGQVSAVRSGSFEVGPFIGASYGTDAYHVMAGGNITYALKNKYVLPYFEYSYFPGLPVTVSGTFPCPNCTGGGSPYTYRFGIPVSDIHGGVHIRLPIFKESSLVPYLVFGLGVLHYSSQTRSETVTFSDGTPPLTFPLQVAGASDFAINGGGGFRYYIGGTGKFGFRTEAKVYGTTSGAFSNITIGKVEAGFFFQLR